MTTQTTSSLRILKGDPLYESLRLGDRDAYERAARGRDAIDLSDCDLRGCDLRHVDPHHVVLRGAYLRDCDLRGLDLRDSDLAGCSLRNAKVGGTWFPDRIPAAEIALSLTHGTRLR